MEAQYKQVQDILGIYIKKASSLGEKEQKIVCITGMFDYLSTRAVKPLLQTPRFANLRQVLLRKIHEFKQDAYVRKNVRKLHRFIAVLDEMFTYLVQDDSVPRRRSERQKVLAVKRFNARFQGCSNPECQIEAAKLNELNSTATKTMKPVIVKPDVVKPVIVKPDVVKPINIKIKVLPRRSARLMDKLIPKGN